MWYHFQITIRIASPKSILKIQICNVFCNLSIFDNILGLLQMWDPNKVTMSFKWFQYVSILTWSNDLDDLGYPQ